MSSGLKDFQGISKPDTVPHGANAQTSASAQYAANFLPVCALEPNVAARADDVPMIVGGLPPQLESN